MSPPDDEKMCSMTLFRRGSVAWLALLAFVGCPTPVWAGNGLQVEWWSAGPFLVLLLGIAFLPLFAAKWWHANRNKALFVVGLSFPVVVYLYTLGPVGQELFAHEMGEYFAFIALLTALYVISGGIVVRGDIQGRPATNVVFFAIGAVLANFIGTTGASMVLIRPVLRINSQRRHTKHIPVFFIFIVSNLGGLLTPLGDPPLFLGFLKGVPFFWTLQLWQPWLLVNGMVLAIFWVWDNIAYRRESPADLQRDRVTIHRFRISGLALNGTLLGVVLGAVLLQAPAVGAALGQALGMGNLTLQRPLPEFLMFVCAIASATLSPHHHHKDNQFTWGPIIEVAILFAGIFATITPALCLLVEHGGRLPLKEPVWYFLSTGTLSSILDNAPTYVTFGTLAAGGDDFGALARNQPLLLAAISCGAVFMGANTYIGNGPNFMVKAIAEESGYPMPNFGMYILRYVLPVLVPTYIVVVLCFFV